MTSSNQNDSLSLLNGSVLVPFRRQWISFLRLVATKGLLPLPSLHDDDNDGKKRMKMTWANDKEYGLRSEMSLVKKNRAKSLDVRICIHVTDVAACLANYLHFSLHAAAAAGTAEMPERIIQRKALSLFCELRNMIADLPATTSVTMINALVASRRILHIAAHNKSANLYTSIDVLACKDRVEVSIGFNSGFWTEATSSNLLLSRNCKIKWQIFKQQVAQCPYNISFPGFEGQDYHALRVAQHREKKQRVL